MNEPSQGYKVKVRYLTHVINTNAPNALKIDDDECQLAALLEDDYLVVSHNTFAKRGNIIHTWVLSKRFAATEEEDEVPISNPEAEEANLDTILSAIRAAQPEDEEDKLATANIVPLPVSVPSTDADKWVGEETNRFFGPPMLDDTPLDESNINFDDYTAANIEAWKSSTPTPDEDDDVLPDDEQVTEPHPAAHHISFLTAFNEPTIVPTFAQAMEAMSRGELTSDDVLYFGDMQADAARRERISVTDTFTQSPRFLPKVS